MDRLIVDPDEALQELTNEVVNLISVPIQRTRPIYCSRISKHKTFLCTESVSEDINCAWIYGSPYEHCGFNNGTVVVGLTLDDAACVGTDDGTGSPCALNAASCDATMAGSMIKCVPTSNWTNRRVC